MTIAIDENRPHLQGFAAFYQSEVEPWLMEQEAKRKSVLKGAWLYSGFAAAALLAGIAGIAILGSNTGGYIAIGLGVLAAAVLAGIGWVPVGNFKDSVKAYLLDKICSRFGIDYSKDAASFPFASFREVSLVPSHDRRKLEDQMTGAHDGVSFSLIEAHLEEKRRDKDNKTYYVTVFRGLLFMYSFPKSFNGKTVIKRDGGVLGNFFGGFGKDQRIRLEDPRFEKMYEVYGSDQVEARYLLTPTFMERVVALGQTAGRKPPEFCFTGENLMIAVPTTKDQFEGGSVFRTLNDPKRVQDLVSEIGIVFDIIDTLKLNLKTNI